LRSRRIGAISRLTPVGAWARVLRNWILGFLAMAIWTTNYLVYFAPDIRAWYRRWRQPAVPASGGFVAPPTMGFMGPLPPHQRVRFPPEPPAPPPQAAEPPHQSAEVIPFPHRYRPRPDKSAPGP
jgi:hypothetical protein